MKQKIVLIIGISLSLTFGVEAKNDKKDTTMDRIETCKQNYTRLFGGEALSGKGSDPELMDILQKFIFHFICFLTIFHFSIREYKIKYRFKACTTYHIFFIP